MALASRGRVVAVRREGECLALVGTADDAWELVLEESGYSPAYGVLVPAPVVRWSARAACPAEFASVIGFDPAMLEATLARVDRGADGAVAYEYAAGGDRRWCFFRRRRAAMALRRVGQRCRHAVLSFLPQGVSGN